VVSRFARTMQTARILLGPAGIPILVDPRLDEVNYGAFEGRPWTEYGGWLDRHGRNARPPGADESLRQAQARMLAALAACLAYPGPRLLVTHGCLLALISSIRCTGDIGGVILPGNAPLDAISLPDEELAWLAGRGAMQLKA
jgi:probable phosphoglycerate mutase